MTRWNNFYKDDARVLSAMPTNCVKYATDIFTLANAKIILDLGCGVGRDSRVMSERGLNIIGLDAAHTALMHAKNKSYLSVLTRADARSLPFLDGIFDGVYCFGLLHEFVGTQASSAILAVITEIRRVLKLKGHLILSALAGNPKDGLPHVRLFTEQMFDEATKPFICVDKQLCDDIGCTGSADYKIWRGTYINK